MELKAITRETVASILKMDIAEVTFTKADGSERVMKCTLKSDVVPVVEKKEGPGRAVNDAVLPVWDIDKDSWRSFRIDAITAIRVV
jgi:hypothetical protein